MISNSPLNFFGRWNKPSTVQSDLSKPISGSARLKPIKTNSVVNFGYFKMYFEPNSKFCSSCTSRLCLLIKIRAFITCLCRKQHGSLLSMVPMLSPFICSLRDQEVKAGLWTLVGKKHSAEKWYFTFCVCCLVIF